MDSQNPRPKKKSNQVAEAEQTDEQETEEFGEEREQNHAERTSWHSYQTSRKTHSSAGSFEADQKKKQLAMQRVLGTIEQSFTSPKPIFPQSVLGHLFMRKFGLTKEQRAQVIRSTGGSSRFRDVERIMRASDFEDGKHEDRRQDRRQKPYPPSRHRRDTFQVEAESDSSLSVPPSTESDQDVLVADEEGSGTSAEELQEAFEVAKQAKKDFKRNARTYKESKRKVREIKKSRQPFYSVVAVPPGEMTGSGPSSQQSQQKPVRHDRTAAGSGGKGDRDRKGGPRRDRGAGNRREEAHFAEAESMGHDTGIEFSYAVMFPSGQHATELGLEVDEALLASIPAGFAVLDTGCTTTVVGETTAADYMDVMTSRGMKPPEQVTLPPIELRGFNGQSEKTTKGILWHVKIGKLKGTLSSYVVPGQTPFLLSRRVLEGMGATLDLGNQTISSIKHGMNQEPLSRAANGHLLLPLCPEASHDDFEAAAVEGTPEVPSMYEGLSEPLAEVVELESQTSRQAQPARSQYARPRRPVQPRHDPTQVDLKRAVQSIARNTKDGCVNVADHGDALGLLFGPEVFAAYVAYRPRRERMPREAETVDYDAASISLGKDGTLERVDWHRRAAGPHRREVSRNDIVIFAFRPVGDAAPETSTSMICLCCSEVECSMPPHDVDVSLETLYAGVDWTDVTPGVELEDQTREHLEKCLRRNKRLSLEMLRSGCESRPDQIRKELQAWLGSQAKKLEQKVGLVEVFAGQAMLSQVFETQTGLAAISLGLQHGQNFENSIDQRLLLQLLVWCRPLHVWVSFPCTFWSPWTFLNLHRSQKTRERIQKGRALGRRHLHLTSEVWHLQTQLGGACHLENPLSSRAWAELDVQGAASTRVDQCSLGLKEPNSGMLIMKPTKIVSTHESVVEALSRYRCSKEHSHCHVEGSARGIGSIARYAENYPRSMCTRLVKALRTVAENRHEALAIDLEELEPEDAEPSASAGSDKLQHARALVRKLHVNTGHASVEQMLRLGRRCKASELVMKCIREFQCSICHDLKPPMSHRKAAMQHATQPNEIVGIDYVQVELRRTDPHGSIREVKRNVLTCVCLATDFCVQVVVEPGSHGLTDAFRQAWVRPYGAPRVVFMDPDHRNMSHKFQQFLVNHKIQLLLAGSESHWQLGRVEIANRVLRNMAQRVWQDSRAPPEEVIEICSSMRNDHLRKNGFSPSQWFLGRSPRCAGMLHEVEAQADAGMQSVVLDSPELRDSLRLRELAAIAFHEEHAKDTWRRAIAGRHRTAPGPFITGQTVYFFRKTSRGLLSTRHGAWLGPAQVIGTESSSGLPVPRVVWISYNGYLYRCSPEAVRAASPDEDAFRHLSRRVLAGTMSPELSRAEDGIRLKTGNFSQYRDLTRRNGAV